MTGPEFVAGKAATTAASVAKKAMSESDAVKVKLLEMSEESPALKEASELYARRVQIKQAILNKIFEPLAKLLGVRNEYFDSQFAEDLSDRMASIPEENMTSPLPSLALPAMQGLGWSLDEPDLKQMYLNLLATASDNRISDEAHPSFAEIIKQLSAEEARNLTPLLKSPRPRTIAELRLEHPGGKGYNPIVTNLYEPLDGVVRNRFSDPREGVWLDNWVRLGLVVISYAEHLTAPNLYDWVESRPEAAIVRQIAANEAENDRLVREALSESEAPPEPVARVFVSEKGTLRVTAFGERFIAAVDAPADGSASPTP